MLVYGAIAVMLAVAAAIPGFAQGSDWGTLQRIRPGARVRIDLQNGRHTEGTLVGWSSGSIAIASPAGPRSFVSEQVRRVRIEGHSSRWRGAMIGALVGFGAGFSVGVTSAGHLTDRNSPGAAWRTAVGGGLGLYGAGIGAAIGALARGHKPATIYHAGTRR